MTPARGSRAGVVFVHAHPDDESIFTGATMAAHAARGVPVTLVTCTRGERGEVIPPELAHLTRDRALGPHRERELAAALDALGVHDHRYLGAGRRTYRDSGMAYDARGRVVPAPDPDPEAFALADLDEAAADLALVLRQVRPQAVVTYEPGGGYGHPDHVQTHRVTHRAVELAALPGPGGAPHEVARIYWTVVPRSVAEAFPASGRAEATVAAWPKVPGLRCPDPTLPVPSMVVPDDQVTAVVDGTTVLRAKVEALRAHATQVRVLGDLFALSNGLLQPILPVEHYRLVRGHPRGPFDAAGRETDLLAGDDLPGAGNG